MTTSKYFSKNKSVDLHTPKPIIGYLTLKFPALTNTFVYREVMVLRKAGLDIETFSIWRPKEGKFSEEARHLVDTTFYIFPINWLKLLYLHFYYFCTRPIKYFKTIGYLLTRRNMKFSHRRRTFVHFIYALYMAAEVQQLGISHLHIHFALSVATVAMVISKLLGITYSITAHANDIFDEPILLKEKLENAKFVVTISEYNKKHLQQFIAQDKIHIVHYGVDLSQFPPLPVHTNGVTPVILSIGRLVEKKGFPYLIRACQILVERGYRFKCKIVGDGPQKEVLQQMIADAKLGNTISLEGAVLQEQLMDYWQETTIFTLPCITDQAGDRDGMPNVLIEAMALQVPPISTTLVGIPEFIEHGYSGLLVPPNDAQTLADMLGRLLDNRGLRVQMGQNARFVAEQKFDIYRNTKHLLNLLTSS